MRLGSARGGRLAGLGLSAEGNAQLHACTGAELSGCAAVSPEGLLNRPELTEFCQ